MTFEEHIKENKIEFTEKVNSISGELGIDPNWLMFVMWFESAKTFSPSIKNKISGATGLIQFMPRTARLLGTTTDALAKMTNVQQLDYVKKYFEPYKGRMKNWLDVYCAVFYPVLVGKPDNYVITSDIVARQNPGFDLNKDLDIHKYEIRAALMKMVPVEYKHLFK